MMFGEGGDDGSGAENGEKTVKIERIKLVVLETIFIIPIVLFAITGVLIIRRLRKYFCDFYQQFHCQLVLVTIGLTIPLTLRSIYDLVFQMPSTYLTEYLDKYEVLFNLINVFFLDFLPIVFQLLTMVFGYIRQKTTQQRRKVEERLKKYVKYGESGHCPFADDFDGPESVWSTLSQDVAASNFFLPPIVEQDSRNGSFTGYSKSHKRENSMVQTSEIGSQMQ